MGGALTIVALSALLPALLPAAGEPPPESPPAAGVPLARQVRDGRRSDPWGGALIDEPPSSFCLGEENGYGRRNVIVRVLCDLPTIPAGARDWHRDDWAAVGGLAGGVLLLMAPLGPSPDARLQRSLNRPAGVIEFFPRLQTEEMTLVTLAVLGGTAGAGWLFDQPRLHEWASLTAESIAVAQLYHLTAKFSLGREGPAQGDGALHGPAYAAKIFPSGTPSGHAATVCATAAVTVEYLDSPTLSALALAGCGYISTSLLLNNQHFVSDILWGAPMGYAIGRWVVRHRSTRHLAERRSGPLPDFRLAGAGPLTGPEPDTRGLVFSFVW